MLDFRLLFRKLFIAGPYLLSFLDAGIALQGLIAQVIVKLPIHRPGGRYVMMIALNPVWDPRAGIIVDGATF